MIGFSKTGGAGEIKEEIDWRSRVFDSLSLPALILEPNRVVLDANLSFLKQYGIGKDEIIGQTCHEFFYQSEDPCPYDTCPLSKVLAEKTGQTILRRVHIRGRKEKWEDRIFSPILDQNGEVRYIIEKIRDVTHVKKLERELSGIKVFMGSSTGSLLIADSGLSSHSSARAKRTDAVPSASARRAFGWTGSTVFSRVFRNVPAPPPRRIRQDSRSPPQGRTEGATAEKGRGIGAGCRGGRRACVDCG